MLRPGAKIGTILIQESLGQGGMGVVWAGFDEKLRREVAVKEVRAERLDAETRARLLAEARILSRLDHPRICRVYDYREEDDRGFLILERVRGRELSQALGDGLDFRGRLAVAEQVAEALTAAHASGVVHRDLKLANVMLTAESRVKVLDFGLARFLDAPEPSPPAAAASPPGAVEAGSAVRGSLTELGAVVGTPRNMSPEQARGEPATAASDLYSLGLLLQELFTGRPPYEPGISDQLLLVKAAEADTLPVEGVDADVASLVERLKSPSPKARPSAAETLGRLRWIRDKPRRKRRRLTLAAAAAALAAAALLAGVKYTLDLERERNAAVAARQESEQVVEFLVGLFEASDPSQARGETLTARQLLDRGAGQVQRSLEEQPLVRARLLATLGGIYRELGLYDDARPLLEEALEIRRRALGPDHPDVAESLLALGDLERLAGGEAEPLYQRALEIGERTFGPEDPKLADILNKLGVTHASRGAWDEARSYFQRALEIRERALGADHPDVAASLNNLAGILLFAGRPEEALPLLERGLEIRERALPPDHPDLAANLEALGMAYLKQGDAERALASFERALAIVEKVYGPEHPRVAAVLTSLGDADRRTGREDAAEAAYRRALEIKQKALGPEHPSLAYPLHNLADLLADRGDLAAAEPLYRRALALLEKALEPSHPTRIEAAKSLAELLRRTGRGEEAAQIETRAGLSPPDARSSGVSPSPAAPPPAPPDAPAHPLD